MHGKELQRYRRLFVEKHVELLTESTGAVIPSARGVEGDPADHIRYSSPNEQQPCRKTGCYS